MISNVCSIAIHSFLIFRKVKVDMNIAIWNGRLLVGKSIRRPARMMKQTTMVET